MIRDDQIFVSGYALVMPLSVMKKCGQRFLDQITVPGYALVWGSRMIR